MKIHILDPLVANQIAAGEVIERPASIVKECMENSFDARATHIEVAIEHGGLQSIRITDNGEGIAKEDLPNALLRHGTSKITSAVDLSTITSLGFRGEALASICSIAKVELMSLEKDAHVAWQIKAEGTETYFTEQPIAHPKGTTIIVRDIFFNIPARRRFLRTEKTEFLKIEEVVNRAALGRFETAFKLSHNQKQIYNLPRALTEEQQTKRIQQVLGKGFIEAALKIDIEVTGLRLWGWIADAHFSRAQADMQFMYINGRMVRDKLINHAIKQVFSGVLSNECFPAYILFLECDPSCVDVNVHPTKHEVRFHENRLIHDFIFSSIGKVLKKTDNFMESFESSKNYPSLESGSDAYQISETQTDISYSTPDQHKISSQPEGVTNVRLLLGEPIGLIENQFLVTLTDTALGLLNIHKAKIILFENAIQNQRFSSKPLLFPLSFQLTENGIQNLSKHLTNLEKMGFDIEVIGPKELALRQVPVFLEAVYFEKLFQDFANNHSNDFIQFLINNVHEYIRPIDNKSEQEKFLKAIQKNFSEAQIQSCFKFLKANELAKLL